MAIVTVDQVKTNLGFTDADAVRDARISASIAKVEADYLKIRNADFDLDEAGAISYPGDAVYTASEMIAFLLDKKWGIKSESLPGGYSYTAEEMLQGYPKSIVGSIRRFVRFI